MQNTTKIAGLVMGLSLTNPLDLLRGEASSASGTDNKKSDKPALIFPVISDVHISRSVNTGVDKFSEALDQLNELVPMQDAFVIVGDLTDNGFADEYDVFMSTYNARKQSQAVSMLAIGNHDYWNELTVAGSQQRFIEKTGMESIYYHKIVKGYHFIVLGSYRRELLRQTN